MSKFQKLVASLESGLGATALSPNLKNITLIFSQKTKAMGARHFWRENLPRIQYVNPNLNIIVNQQKEVCDPKLEITFADSTTKSFNIQNMRSEDICNQLINSAKA